MRYIIGQEQRAPTGITLGIAKETPSKRWALHSGGCRRPCAPAPRRGRRPGPRRGDCVPEGAATRRALTPAGSPAPSTPATQVTSLKPSRPCLRRSQALSGREATHTRERRSARVTVARGVVVKGAVCRHGRVLVWMVVDPVFVNTRGSPGRDARGFLRSATYAGSK